ncbi:MAG: hypothetical protein ACR2P0_09395 [Acidimicrobiales bacterium]
MVEVRTIVMSPHVNHAVVDGQMVLFSHADRYPRLLNATAAHIFLLAGSPIAELDIVEAVARAHAVATLDVAADVCGVLDALIDDDLCRLVESQVEADAPLPTPRRSLNPPATAIGPIMALGTRLFIDVPTAYPELREQLSNAVDPLRSLDLRSDRGDIVVRIDVNGAAWTIFANDTPVTTVGSPVECRRMVLSLLNTLPLELVEDGVVLHAASARVNGMGVVFPGDSGAGKSTIVAQLIARGHGYLTDEAVVIDLRDLVAEPFPKSLRIEPGAQRLLSHLEPHDSELRDASWDVDPRSIEPASIAGRASIERIVFPQYRKGVRRAVLRRVQPVDALLRLLRATFDFRASGQEGFGALARLAESVPAYELLHSGHGQLEAVETLASPAATGGSPADRRTGEPRLG